MNSKPKILFLDIDGVLNSQDWYEEREQQFPRDPWDFDPKAIVLLNKILNRTGCTLVLSSTWRKSRTLEEMNKIFDNVGIYTLILDFTPDFNRKSTGTPKQRGYEIQHWLLTHPHNQFAVLDDGSDMDAVRPNLIQTSWDHSLQQQHVDQVCKLLGEPELNG